MLGNAKITKLEACHDWVRGFNAIDQNIIGVLMEHDAEDWTEVTLPAVGDRAFVYEENDEGEIVDIENKYGYEIYTIKLDNGNVVKLDDADEFVVERYTCLPMWSTMWSFDELWNDEDWLEDKGIACLSECGFRVYHSEEYGYFFGIDGTGYDFYEAHWLPLYDAVGLKWHDVD